jgi:hypothetical protein
MFGLIIEEGVPHVPVTWNWQHEAHVGSFAHVAMPISSSPTSCELLCELLRRIKESS